MLRVFLFALASAFVILSSNSSFAACSHKEKWIWNYDGSINEQYLIRLSLSRTGTQINGVYFYHKYLKDIELTGLMPTESEIVLYEHNSDGEIVAEFQGKFLSEDPEGRFSSKDLQCEILAGEWISKNSNSRLPFFLRMSSGSFGRLDSRYAVAGVNDDDLAHQNAYGFWTAVKSNNKSKAAKFINYPIIVNYDLENHTITNESQFIENYDKIIPDWKKKAIAKAIPRNMSASWRGIMLGRGVVYFGKDGKVSNL